MERRNTLIEYENEVRSLLKQKLIEEGIQERHLIDYYRFPGNDRYRFDLVEIDDNDNVIRLFEIRSPQFIKYNRNYTYRLVERFQEITQAPVFLVFLDDEKNLQILSSQEILNYINAKTRNSSITSFETYYRKIAHICVDESDSKYFFRGHADYMYESTPSIYRDQNIKYERFMFHLSIVQKFRRSKTHFTHKS